MLPKQLFLSLWSILNVFLLPLLSANEYAAFDYDRGYRIGAGSFGEVYQVRHKTTKEEYIMKVEANSSHSLTREAGIYFKLRGESKLCIVVLFL